MILSTCEHLPECPVIRVYVCMNENIVFSMWFMQYQHLVLLLVLLKKILIKHFEQKYNTIKGGGKNIIIFYHQSLGFCSLWELKWTLLTVFLKYKTRALHNTVCGQQLYPYPVVWGVSERHKVTSLGASFTDLNLDLQKCIISSDQVVFLNPVFKAPRLYLKWQSHHNVTFAILDTPALCPLKSQLCQDGLQLVNGPDLSDKFHQSWTPHGTIRHINFASLSGSSPF